MADYYRTLGVDPSASIVEIRTAHRAMMRRVHPDVAGPTPESTARAATVNEAWAVLRDPRSRARYDRVRSRGSKTDGETSTPPPAAGVPSWGPGGVRPVTVEQLREAAARERAYSEVGRQQREAFSAASRRVGLRIVGASAVLLALVVAVVATGV